MDLALLEKIVASTGLGGLGIWAMFILYKAIIGAKFISKLKQDHSFLIMNNVVKIIGCVAVVAVISWAALKFYEIKNASLVTSETKVATTPRIEYKTLSKRIRDYRPDTNVPVATIEMEYVVVSGLGNASMERKINSYISNAIGINETYDGTEDHEMKVVIASIEGQMLSVVAEGYFYGHGAASAANRVVSINLNLTTGDPVEFKDLFRSGYVKKVNELAAEWLSINLPGHWFETVTDNQCYYVADGHLNLCFSEYEVAAGANGNVTVKLKLDSLRGIVSLNGPLGFAY
ncbi:DUF3298 domain-containing protein [Pseudomonas farsensis]|uniref:DUF3298 domain-containing protein n=1 Tax=Pseudomonas farsensis TaxID=2745492 RepID=A0ABU8QNW7_9PSED